MTLDKPKAGRKPESTPSMPDASGKTPLVCFTVPGLIPPSVNHYKEPVIVLGRLGKRHIAYSETGEAKAFKAAVVLFARQAGATGVLVPKTQAGRDKVRYELSAKVVLGPRQRGDGDNFWKALADSLVQAGVIHSDARVRRWIMEVEDGEREQASSPRTEIKARVICPWAGKTAGAYDRLIAPVREAAGKLGYALGLHGSVERDIDLIAVAWTDEAGGPDELAEAVRATAERVTGLAFVAPHDPYPGFKPHGRLTYSFHLGGGPYIDLSVIPPVRLSDEIIARAAGA